MAGPWGLEDVQPLSQVLPGLLGQVPFTRHPSIHICLSVLLVPEPDSWCSLKDADEPVGMKNRTLMVGV
jgi:hypothetical protein